MSNKKWVWFPYVIGCLALWIGTFYDYAITDFLYSKMSYFGIFFEKIALFPLIVLVAFSFALFARFYRNKLWEMASFITCIYALWDLKKYWLSYDNLFIYSGVAVLAIVLWFLLHTLTKQFSYDFIKRRIHWFQFYVCVLLSAMLLTTVLKLFWGRIRYRQLEHALQFVPWYQIHLFSGYVSFPSGHTTAFSAILCFLEWKENPYEKVPKWKFFLIWGLLLAMPISRMIQGAHYLSDTAVGFMITYTMYLWYRHWFGKRGYL